MSNLQLRISTLSIVFLAFIACSLQCTILFSSNNYLSNILRAYSIVKHRIKSNKYWNFWRKCYQNFLFLQKNLRDQLISFHFQTELFKNKTNTLKKNSLSSKWRIYELDHFTSSIERTYDFIPVGLRFAGNRSCN